VIQYLRANLTLDPIPEGVGPVPLPPGAGAAKVRDNASNRFKSYITVQEISAKDLFSLTGPSNYVDSIMQINCWCADREEAHRMRTRVKALLINHSGAVGSLNIDGSEHVLDAVLYDSDREVHQSIVRIHMAWTLA